jgi:hypothetical protein
MGFICGDKQLRVNVVIHYVEVKIFRVKSRPLRFRLLEEVARLSTLMETRANTDVSSSVARQNCSATGGVDLGPTAFVTIKFLTCNCVEMVNFNYCFVEFVAPQTRSWKMAQSFYFRCTAQRLTMRSACAARCRDYYIPFPCICLHGTVPDPLNGF